MTETSKSSLMVIASLMIGILVIASGYFLFTRFMGDVTEQRQQEEFIKLQGEISKRCQETKLNPGNLHTGDQFTLLAYEGYKMFYMHTASYEVEQVCKAQRCVCFGRTGSAIPSDCFSLDHMECQAGAYLKHHHTSTGESNLDLWPSFNCRYLGRMKWDKTNIVFEIFEAETPEAGTTGRTIGLCQSITPI